MVSLEEKMEQQLPEAKKSEKENEIKVVEEQSNKLQEDEAKIDPSSQTESSKCCSGDKDLVEEVTQTLFKKNWTENEKGSISINMPKQAYADRKRKGKVEKEKLPEHVEIKRRSQRIIKENPKYCETSLKEEKNRTSIGSDEKDDHISQDNIKHNSKPRKSDVKKSPRQKNTNAKEKKKRGRKPTLKVAKYQIDEKVHLKKLKVILTILTPEEIMMKTNPLTARQDVSNKKNAPKNKLLKSISVAEKKNIDIGISNSSFKAVKNSVGLPKSKESKTETDGTKKVSDNNGKLVENTKNFKNNQQPRKKLCGKRKLTNDNIEHEKNVLQEEKAKKSKTVSEPENVYLDFLAKKQVAKLKTDRRNLSHQIKTNEIVKDKEINLKNELPVKVTQKTSPPQKSNLKEININPEMVTVIKIEPNEAERSSHLSTVSLSSSKIVPQSIKTVNPIRELKSAKFLLKEGNKKRAVDIEFCDIPSHIFVETKILNRAKYENLMLANREKTGPIAVKNIKKENEIIPESETKVAGKSSSMKNDKSKLEKILNDIETVLDNEITVETNKMQSEGFPAHKSMSSKTKRRDKKFILQNTQYADESFLSKTLNFLKFYFSAKEENGDQNTKSEINTNSKETKSSSFTPECVLDKNKVPFNLNNKCHNFNSNSLTITKTLNQNTNLTASSHPPPLPTSDSFGFRRIKLLPPQKDKIVNKPVNIKLPMKKVEEVYLPDIYSTSKTISNSKPPTIQKLPINKNKSIELDKQPIQDKAKIVFHSKPLTTSTPISSSKNNAQNILPVESVSKPPVLAVAPILSNLDKSSDDNQDEIIIPDDYVDNDNILNDSSLKSSCSKPITNKLPSGVLPIVTEQNNTAGIGISLSSPDKLELPILNNSNEKSNSADECAADECVIVPLVVENPLAIPGFD